MAVRAGSSPDKSAQGRTIFQAALRAPLFTPADPDDLVAALAFALKFEGRKRWHDSDAFMAHIVAKRLVRHLERARYVVMRNGRRSAATRG